MAFKKYEIITLDLKSLDASAFFQLITESREVLSDFAKAHKSEEVYTTKVAALEAGLADLSAGLHQSRGSKVATPLDQADQARDDAWATLTSLVRAYSRVKVSQTQTAYEALSGLLDNYKDTLKLSYEKESEQINHLLKVLVGADYQAHLETLHLAPHVAELQATQAAFDKLYKARLAEQTAKTSSQTKALRAQLSEIYDFLVDFTAINAYAYPDKTDFAQLRDQLNTIRSRYKKQKATKKVEGATAAE